jgi:hypothetical protein
MGMNQEEMTARLDHCLLTDAEMALGPENWMRLSDPFPKWQTGEEIEEESDAEMAQ